MELSVVWCFRGKQCAVSSVEKERDTEYVGESWREGGSHYDSVKKRTKVRRELWLNDREGFEPAFIRVIYFCFFFLYQLI